MGRERLRIGGEAERFHGQVRDAPHPSGGIVHGPALCLRGRNELRDVLVALGRCHDHDQGRIAQRDDRGQVAERVVERQRAIGDRHQAVGGGVGEDGVAVGLGARDRRHGDRVARPRAILHDHRLSEPGCDLLHHGARDDIERAARALRNQHAHRLARP